MLTFSLKITNNKLIFNRPQIMSITSEQLSSVANAPTGNGLILCGGNIIPFVNRIPSDNPLYPLVTTKTEKDVVGREAATQAEG